MRCAAGSLKCRSTVGRIGEAGVGEAGVSEAGVSEAGVGEAGVSEAGVGEAGVSFLIGIGASASAGSSGLASQVQ